MCAPWNGMGYLVPPPDMTVTSRLHSRGAILGLGDTAETMRLTMFPRDTG